MAPSIRGLDRARVEDEIHAQEKNTAAEIVAAVATQSDDYLHVPIHIATGLALLVPIVLPFAASILGLQQPGWDGVQHLSYIGIIAIQLLVFVLAATLLSLECLRARITPRRLKLKYARRLASEQFLASRMHTTAGRSGVFIFASLLERHVEIIADVAAADRIPDHHWQEIIAQMIPLLRNGQVTEAFVLGVECAGKVLANVFPPAGKNPNELQDRMIVIDEGG